MSCCRRMGRAGRSNRWPTMRWWLLEEARQGSCWQVSWRWRGSTLPLSSGAPVRTSLARAQAVCIHAPSRFLISVESLIGSLSVLGTPVKVGSVSRFVVWPRSGHVPYRGGPVVGVEVERPQRSEDERPRGRRGSAAYSVGQDETKEVVVQVICGPPVRVRSAGERCACRRPALSGSTDEGPAT